MWRIVSASLYLCVLLLGACTSDQPRFSLDEIDLAVGDAGSGEKLFNQSNNEAPACSACHAVSGADSSLGNSLADIAEAAGTRVRGQSAYEYLYWSILRPGQFLVSGYSNLMYGGYEDSLEAADLADLITYLLTLD